MARKYPEPWLPPSDRARVAAQDRAAEDRYVALERDLDLEGGNLSLDDPVRPQPIVTVEGTNFSMERPKIRASTPIRWGNESRGMYFATVLPEVEVETWEVAPVIVKALASLREAEGEALDELRRLQGSTLVMRVMMQPLAAEDTITPSLDGCRIFGKSSKSLLI